MALQTITDGTSFICQMMQLKCHGLAIKYICLDYIGDLWNFEKVNFTT